MNYQKIYNQLVEKRKNILVEGYKEKHHIIPRCIGGSDQSENLVRLTAREHFIAHLLLTKIYDNEKLIYAFNMMSSMKRYTNRIYSHLKEKFSVIHSQNVKGEKNPNFGKSVSEEHKKKLSKLKKGIPLSEEHKKKLSKSAKGRCKSEEHKRKISESNKGKHNISASKETKRKMSETRKGVLKSEETKKRMSEASKGRKKSSEHMKKIWETRRKNKRN